MHKFYFGLGLFVTMFLAAMSPLGTEWSRGSDRTESVCLDVLMQTGDRRRITTHKPPYAGISVGGSRGTYYLSSWEWSRFMFIPIRAGFTIKMAVIDYEYCKQS